MYQQVLTKDYLKLQSSRLRAQDQWSTLGDGLCFLFAQTGAGEYVKGPARQALSPGDVLLVKGDANGRVCPSKGGEFEFSAFFVRLDHLFPLFACAEISLLQRTVENFKGHRFYGAGGSLALECTRLLAGIPREFDLEHRGQLIRLAATILNPEFKAHSEARPGFVRPEEHLVEVFEKLSADDILGLSVDELAGKFACSRRHLNRLFHYYLGFSVGGLRMEIRLLKAVSLLRNPTAKVINVAEECGFNHLGLFNTCFKRRFGTTPGRWRLPGSDMKRLTVGADAAESGCPLHVSGLCPVHPRAAGPEIYPIPIGLANGSNGHKASSKAGGNGSNGGGPLKVEATLVGQGIQLHLCAQGNGTNEKRVSAAQ